MLDYPVAMFASKMPLFFQFFILLLLLQPGEHRISAQQVEATPEPGVVIASPLGGEALQGKVAIKGSTDLEGFSSVEISFAYQNDPTHTWFLLGIGQQPVKESVLADWDTTTITDGTYRLRVQVFLKNGQVKEMIQEGLRVRNYSPVETSTPSPSEVAGGQRTPRPTDTPTATPLPAFQPQANTPEVLPTNPIEVNPGNLLGSLTSGVIAVIVLFLIGVFYTGLKSFFRK